MSLDEENKDFSKLKPEQVFFLHQKNVNLICKTKEDIIKDLSGFTGVSQNITGLNNKDFNDELLTKYKDFLGEIKYDTFVEERSEYEKTKKEILKRIETLKENKIISALIEMLEDLRGEKMKTSNFIDFYRIIVFLKKSREEQEERLSELITLLEGCRGEKIDADNFIDFYRIVGLLQIVGGLQKDNQNVTSRDFSKINNN